MTEKRQSYRNVKGEDTILVNRTQMNADYRDFKYTELTERNIKIFYKVYNKLGYGFPEKVYENVMMLEIFSACICEIGVPIFNNIIGRR